MNKLKDRVAIVTGAGAGIGRATALRLADDGADVLVADIQDRKLESVVIAFLASDDARYITGIVLDVNGGEYMG